MKITDNYAREAVADWLIAENVKPNVAAEIVDLLNGSPKRDDCDWYRVVSDDHKLWRGMAEFA